MVPRILRFLCLPESTSLDLRRKGDRRTGPSSEFGVFFGFSHHWCVRVVNSIDKRKEEASAFFGTRIIHALNKFGIYLVFIYIYTKMHVHKFSSLKKRIIHRPIGICWGAPLATVTTRIIRFLRGICRYA